MIDFSWIDSQFAFLLCLTLLHSIWQFSLLALLASMLDRLIKQRSVEWRYSINVVALIIGVVMLPLTFALLSSHQTANDVAASAFSRTNFNQVDPSPKPELGEQIPFNDQQAKSPTAQVDQSQPMAHTKSVVTTTTPWRLSLATWAAALYVIGVVLMLLRLARSLVHANRLSVQGRALTDGPAFEVLQRLVTQWSMSVAPTLRLAEDVVAPKVVGILRSTILLPTSALSGLTPDQLEMILAHESAHVSRHDMWANLLQRVAEAILFFNPALWFLSRRISALREYCCDEMACEAVSHRAGETRTRYAEALLRVVEMNQSPTRGASGYDAVASLAASGSSPSELRRRVAHLFGDSVCEPVRMTRRGAFTLAGTLLLLFSVSTVWNTGLSGLSLAKMSMPQANWGQRGVTINGKYWPPGSAVFRDQSGALLPNNSFTGEPLAWKPDVVLEGSFSDQADSILAEALVESGLPFLTEQRIEEICDEFSELLQLDSIDLEQLSEERRIAVLTSLRNKNARQIRLAKSTPHEAHEINYIYLDFPDQIKTLKWKLWMALSRGELTANEQARQSKQQQWMREAILSLPDNRYGRRQIEVCNLDDMFNDPLMPQFDRVMSDKQFTKFQNSVQAMLETASLFGIANRFRWMAFKSCWPRDNVATIGSFDEDKILSISMSGNYSNLGIWFKFVSNDRHRGKSKGLSDFYSGNDFSALDCRGHSTETLWKIRKNRDPDEVLRSLEEREVGHVILDATKSELVGIRGTKLLRLDTDLLHAADAISDQELRRLVETQGTERVDLSDCFAKYMEFDKDISRDRPAGAIFGILSAEGDLAVWWTEYFSKYTSGELNGVHFHARHRIAQLEP